MIKLTVTESVHYALDKERYALVKDPHKVYRVSISSIEVGVDVKDALLGIARELEQVMETPILDRKTPSER